METSAATHTDSPLGQATASSKPLSTRRGRNRSVLLVRRLLVVDLLAAALASTGAATLATVQPANALVIVLTALAAWPAICFGVGLYVRDDLRFWASGVPEASHTLVAAILFGWPVLGGVTLARVSGPAGLTLLIVVATTTLSSIGRAAARSVVHRLPELDQHVVILGSGLVAGQLAQKLRTNEQFGLNVIGLVDDDAFPLGDQELPVLGALSDLPAVLDSEHADRVIIAFTRASHEQLLGCIRACQERGVAVDVIPRLFELLDGVRALEQVGGLPILSIGSTSLARSSQVAKRALDIAVSIVALALLAPILLVLALAIKLESRGPVFFRQPRVGRAGRTFQLIKLRSMHVGAEARKEQLAEKNDVNDGVMFKIHSDPRVTTVGRLLRRASLDELPQLINVLLGHMSLVGPRPLIRPEHDALAERWHLRRLELRPGLTGPWQIYGRAQTPFQEMVRLDYQYVAGWSLARDLEILLATVPAVLSGRGAY